MLTLHGAPPRAERTSRAGRAPSRPSPLPNAKLNGDEGKSSVTGVGSSARHKDLVPLLKRVAEGDVGAFDEFYSHTSARAYGLVLRVLRDPGYAEETVQEVYLHVWRSAHTFDPAQGSPLSWLLTVAHRRAVDRVRSEQASTARDAVYGAESHAPSFDIVAEEVEQRSESQSVLDCLGTLTEMQRESISLAYYGGYTYREVAERLSTALPTIKSRIRDGLNKLKDCLGVRHDG
jgi:RNA polymerase sigma-70 factor (ECF subfamily)